MATGETEAEESQWLDFQPESFGFGLKCPVCLDFFTKPHTLGCGHSFCLRCLRTLAKMARTSESRAPLARVRLRCPACRKKTFARPLLRRRASVTIALKDIVDTWLSSPYPVGKLESTTLRSTSCQTNDSPGKSTDDHTVGPTSLENHIENETLDSHKEGVEQSDEDDDISKEEIISREEIRQVLVHRFPAKSNCKHDLKSDIFSKFNRTENLSETNNDAVVSSGVTTETSSSEEESEPEVAPLLGYIQHIADPPIRTRLGIRSFFTILRLIVEELFALFRGIRNSRGKMALTVFWIFYGSLIICFSRAFIPLMMLYTIIYLMILYAEMS